MQELNRYAKITTKYPREFCLLQGMGCRWAQCTFCDYHLDACAEPYNANEAVLRQVTGAFGVLDIINSGSCTELDARTIALIADMAHEKRIHTLWFEAHYMYRDALHAFAAQFDGIKVKFRTGIETFDGTQRDTWRKGVPADITPADVAKFFDGVCLLIGVTGQSRKSISYDIETALALFEYASINAFVENSTGLRRDEGIVAWFTREWLPQLEDEPRIEVLLHNTDLGVG